MIMPDIDMGTVKQNLCAEIGVSDDVLFSEVSILLKYLSTKVSGLEQSSHSFQTLSTKAITRLVSEHD